jgi:hypothetical protein
MKFTQHVSKDPWVDHHFAKWISTIVGMVNFGLGIAILAGGVIRFSAPQYESIIFFAHGNLWWWALWIFLSAVLIAMPFRIANILGFWLGMFWHTIWMVGFAIATLHYETAAATPIPMYGGMAMICAALLTVRVLNKPRE